MEPTAFGINHLAISTERAEKQIIKMAASKIRTINFRDCFNKSSDKADVAEKLCMRVGVIAGTCSSSCRRIGRKFWITDSF
jgi:hypothetical protein